MNNYNNKKRKTLKVTIPLCTIEDARNTTRKFIHHSPVLWTEKEINKNKERKKENKKRQDCLNVKQKADSYPVLPCTAVQTLIVHP
jgi:hypothetical protein